MDNQAIKGIRSGMVMQRGQDGRCRIRIQADETFSRVKCKDQNGSDIPVFIKDGELLGIPAGGPYRLDFDGLSYTDIYVGDVWLLAGQSNMEGNGILCDKDRDFVPREDIRAFYMTDTWAPAKNPLHHCAQAVDEVHTKIYNAWPQTPGTGSGPGIAFALKMHEITGVPQGLIACAHGGTALPHWTPTTKHLGGALSLYGAMLRRYTENGANAAGILWYQGCQDAVNQEDAYFTERMTELIDNFRSDFGFSHPMGRIPVVQVQLGRWSDEVSGFNFDRSWTAVRRLQLELSDSIPAMDTLAAVTFRNDDFVHICGEDAWRLGERMAESMACLKWPEKSASAGLLPYMRIGKISFIKNPVHDNSTDIRIHVDNCHGALKAEPYAMGFALASEPDRLESVRRPYDAYTEGDDVIVRVRMNGAELSRYLLYYGYGCDPDCNITDGRGLPLPCFGPVDLSGAATL